MAETSVLVLAHERLTSRLAGPTIRSWELARALAAECSVTLAGRGEPERQDPRVRLTSFEGRLAELVQDHDVVLCFGYLLESHPEVLAARHLVIDLYDPFTLENLHMHKQASLPEQQRVAEGDRRVQQRLLLAGDMFLCASERQRDFWLGWLSAAGRVNPYVHATDPAIRDLLRVVPFGIPEEPPAPGPPRLRGVVPGVGPDDLVLFWGGGLWNWFDPLTLIRAAERVRDRLPQLRVVFPALDNPGQAAGAMWMPAAARKLAEDLGVAGTAVIFGPGWVPYEERGGLLLEADAGVSLHADDVETRLSFRTRVLDYLWAGLPILTTEGDTLADLVRNEGLGEVVPYGDVDAVASALLRLADRGGREECARRVAGVAPRFHWSRAAEPLLDYCRAPRPAPDRDVMRQEAAEAPAGGQAGLVSRAGQILREEGPAELVRRGSRYVRRGFRRP